MDIMIPSILLSIPRMVTGMDIMTIITRVMLPAIMVAIMVVIMVAIMAVIMVAITVDTIITTIALPTGHPNMLRAEGTADSITAAFPTVPHMDIPAALPAERRVEKLMPVEMIPGTGAGQVQPVHLPPAETGPQMPDPRPLTIPSRTGAQPARA